MSDLVSREYVRVWRTTCVSWLGWSKERFGRFLRCWNGRLSAEGGDVWFGQGRPFEYVIQLFVSDEFEEFLHHKVRKPKYGTSEWIYFEKELLAAFQGGIGHCAPPRGKGFDWDGARRRVEEHLALYGQTLPTPETITNYEKFMRTFELPEFSR